MNAKKKGSTLVELLAVLLISSIFLALLAPAVFNIATNAPPTAARKAIESSTDPSESPGYEPIAAGQSQGVGSCPHQCVGASTVQTVVPNRDVDSQNP